jgi:hypothetical protein
MGAVIFLDEVLPDASAYQQFIQLLDGATQALLEANTFSEYGREWVETVVGSLRTRLSYLSNALV